MCGKGLQFPPSSSEGGGILIPVTEDRELGFLERDTALAGQRGGKVVEGRSPVVNRLADNHTPAKRRTHLDRQADRAFAGLSVEVNLNFERVTRKEVGDLRPELNQVLIRPEEFRPTAGKWLLQAGGPL